jgi:hypothetical protein
MLIFEKGVFINKLYEFFVDDALDLLFIRVMN